jgi:hypothetical protein
LSSIVIFAFVLGGMPPVKFDDQAVREAHEIDKVRANGGLPAELNAEIPGSQKMPEALFGTGGLVAKLSGKVALFLIGVHAVVLGQRAATSNSLLE